MKNEWGKMNFKKFDIILLILFVDLDQIKDTENNQYRDHEAAERGDPVGRQTSRKQKKRDERIARNSQLFDDRLLSLREFLERTRKTFVVRVKLNNINKVTK